MVEVPYVYILVRSGSSVKDQLLYVPTRLEDIADMSVPIEQDGTIYTDTLRLFTGKHQW